jgi:hypothetical protein
VWTHKEIGLDVLDWIQLFQNAVQLQVPVDTVMIFQVS